MISYIKLYGPPIYDAIKELEKIAVGMPEVCIMETNFETISPTYAADPQTTYGYFTSLGLEVTRERCNTIISKSGEKLGEYDFYFEWFKKPDMDELNDLIRRIDKALAPLGAKYSITTK
jgi:hypothetical protein